MRKFLTLFVAMLACTALVYATITTKSGSELEIAINLSQNGAPVNDATCTLFIVYPVAQWHPSDFQVDDTMIMRREQAGDGVYPDGVYKYDWLANVDPGIYNLSVTCTDGETLGNSVVNGFEVI
jgi:hypothetical protein